MAGTPIATNQPTMGDLAEFREMLERHGATFEKWLIRMPNGATWPVVRIPGAAECSVCSTLTEIPASEGRVVCGACGAHILTVSAQ